MKDLIHFKEFVAEINKENGRLYKQSILSKYKNDEVIKKFLKYSFDPFIVFGLGKAKLTKTIATTDLSTKSVFGLLSFLEVNNTGTDSNAAQAQAVIKEISKIDQAAADLLVSIICKDLSLGVDSKTINSIIPNCIKSFSVMLAQKYFEQPERVRGKTFAITTKLDGFRLIAIKDAFGNIKFYSRVGQPVEGLVEIEKEISEKLPNNTALDGELTVSDYFNKPSKDAYKAASKIIRLKGDTPKIGLTYRVFDGMTAEEFTSQKCNKTYLERRAFIDSFAGLMTHVEVLPVLYLGADETKITELLNKVTSQQGEGVMINIVDSKYEWKRTWSLMKVKRFLDEDLPVIGFEEGTGRNIGTLGALLVQYKNNIVKVGSGFTDELRAEIWNNQSEWLGRTVVVQYFETTKNSKDVNSESLRFPVYIDYRTDK